MGDSTPCSLIDAVSSISFSLSKLDLGWNLPGLIFINSTSFTDLWFGLLSPKRASRPLFKVFFSSDILNPSDKLASQS